jgi:hypothetical protein
MDLHRLFFGCDLDHPARTALPAGKVGHVHAGLVDKCRLNQRRGVGDHVAQHIANVVGAAGQGFDAFELALGREGAGLADAMEGKIKRRGAMPGGTSD